MQIIINSFLKNLKSIIISSVVLSIISISIFEMNANKKKEALSELTEKKIIRIQMQPNLDKIPIIFDEAMNVIFLSRFLKDLYPSPKTFINYDFAENLLLKIDIDDYESSFKSQFGNILEEVNLQNTLKEKNFLTITHKVKKYNNNQDKEILNHVRNYFEPIYKNQILNAMENIIVFKKEFSDPINRTRNLSIIKKNQDKFNQLEKSDQFAQLVLLLSIEENAQSIDFIYDEVKVFFDNFAGDGFHYKAKVEKIHKGRSSFEMNISSLLLIIISIFISILLSSAFFVSRSILQINAK